MKTKATNPLLRRLLATVQVISVSFLGFAQGADLYWDGGTANIGTDGDGNSAGGAGTWNTTLTNWDVGAQPHLAWINANNDKAIFGGPAGIVTVTSAVSANNLTFNTTSYSIIAHTTPADLTLSGTAPQLSAGTGITATIDNKIAGTGGYSKTGAGTVILRNTGNSISGAVNVSAGELQAHYNGTTAGTYTTLGTGTITVASGAGLRFKCGSTANAMTYANAINLNGATLTGDDGVTTLTGAVALTGANTIHGVWATKNVSLGGVVSGTGSINKTGPADLLLTNAGNTYSGGTTLAAGNLSISNGTGLGTGALNITSTTGVGVTVANNNATTVANAMALPAPGAAQTYTLTKNASSATAGTLLTWSGNITGGNANTTLRLTSSQSGDATTTYRLTGTNTFTGKVEVLRGCLVLTAPGNLGSVTNTVILNTNTSALGNLRLASAMTLPNPISLLWPASISTEGSNSTLTGVISGAADTTGTPNVLHKVGVGTLSLTANNTYLGPTRVTGGTLQLDYTTFDGTKLADAAVLTFAGGTLDLAGTNSTPHLELVGSTAIAANSGLTRTGATANRIALGAITSTGGALNISADGIATTTNSLINGLLPAFVTVGGTPATTNGSGEIIAASGIVNVNRLGGQITGSAGTHVQIVEGGTAGDVTMATAGVTDIATLFNAGTAAPTLVDIGTGNTLRLAASASIAAGTNGLTLSNGTLTAGGAADTAGTLDLFNASANATTINSVIANNGAGTAGLTKTGSGILVLGGTNTYTGSTSVNAGTLALAGGSAILDTGSITLLNAGATLRLDAGETIGALSTAASTTVNLQGNALTFGDASNTTLAGTITGTLGSLVKTGAGTVTLTGTNNYTGGTTVTDGMLQTNSTAALTGAVSIGATGTLTLNSATSTFANALSGTGTVTVALGTLANTTTLSGNLSGFTGTLMTSAGGKLNLSATGANQLAAGATIKINSSGTLFQFSTATSLASAVHLYGGTTGEAIGQVRLEGGATLSGPVTLFANTSVGNNTAGNVGTISGNIGENGGSFGITKLAAGTITLAGTNTYTGPTTLSAGVLNITGNTGSSALTMAATTTLGGEGTVASLTTSGASTLVVNPQTTGALASNGPLTLGGIMTVSLSLPPTSTGPGNPIRILSHNSATAPATASFALANAASYRNPVFTTTTTAVDLTVDAAANLIWTASGGSNWDVNTTSNWSSTAAPTTTAAKFYTGDSVLFDDTFVAANQTVSLATNVVVAPASVTFNNSTYNYTLTAGAGAGITGTTGITKNGTASLTLGGVTSNFTGPVLINAGVLNLNNGEALGFNSGVTINDGGALNFNGHAPANQGRHFTYTIAGQGADGSGGVGAIYTTGADIFGNAGVRNLVLAGNAEIGGNNGRFDVGLSGGVAGTITGGGFTLTKVGSNAMVFRAPASAITYAVNGGRLSFEDFDAASGTNPITVSNTGSALGTYGPRTIPNDVTLNEGTQLISIGGGNTGTWSGTITAAGNVNFQTDHNLVIDGSLFGTGNITRAGANILVLQNSATGYSGKIINTTGTLRIESNAALGSATGVDVITMGSVANGATTLQGGTITAQASTTIGSATQGITQAGTGGVTYDAGTGNTLTIDGAITGTGNLTKANNTGVMIFNREVNVGGGASGNGGTQTFNGNLTLGTGTFAAGTNIVTNLNCPALTLPFGMLFGTGITNIAIGTGTTKLIRLQEGTNNNHTINHTAGTLNVSNDIRLGHWGGPNPNIYNISGGTLSQPDTVTVTNGQNDSENQANLFLGIDGTGELNISGTGTVNTTSLVFDNRGDTAGNDTLRLTGGTLNIGKHGMLAGNAGGTYLIELGGGTIGNTSSSIDPAYQWSSTWSSSLNMTLTGTNGPVNLSPTSGTTISLTGNLTGSGGLTKKNDGTLNLTSANNTFSGNVLVEAGTLFLTNKSTNPVGLLKSTGGILNPGSQAASAAVHATNTELAGGTARFRIGTGIDRIVTGNVDVTAATSIEVSPVGSLTVGQEYPLIAYSGTVTGLTNLTLIPLSNNRYQTALVNNTTTNSINLKLTAIDTLIWTGTSGSLWDDTTANWKLASNNAPATFLPLDSVVFNDDSTGDVELVGNLNAGAVTVNSATDYNFFGGGSLIGNASIIKAGTGILKLENANQHLGGNAINGGTIKVVNAAGLGVSGNVTTVGAAGTLDLNGRDLEASGNPVRSTGTIVNSNAAAAVINSLELTGNTTITGSNNITVGAFAGTSGTLNLGANTLIKEGSGQLILNGVAVTSGNITINQGSVRLIREYNNNQRDVSLGGTGTLTINPGGTLTTDRWAPSLTVTMPIVLNGGTMTSDWPGPNGATIASPISVTADSAFGFGGGYASVTFSGVISGGGKITRTGDGTLTLTGENTTTGGFLLSQATLQVGNGGATGTLGSGAVENNATLVFNRNNALSVANVISGTGVVTHGGSGTTTLTAVNTYKGNTNVNSGTINLADGGKLNFVIGANGVSNKVAGAGTFVAEGDFTLDLTNANNTTGNAWTLVDVGTLTETFASTFNIDGFTKSGTTHTKVDGLTTWTFSETTGNLSVVTITDPYLGWASFYSLTGDDALRGSDPDGDGFTNLQEYLFGSNPTTGNSALTTTTVSGGNLILRWLQRENGASYLLKESVTLAAGSWTTSGLAPAKPVDQTGVPTDYDLWEVSIPLGAPPAKFYRIEGTEAP